MLSKTAMFVKESFENTFSAFGPPVEIQLDSGKKFRNTLLREFLCSEKIRIIHGRPRNPRGQGQIKRLNQTIKHRLYNTTGRSPEKNWIAILPPIVKRYSTTVYNATEKKTISDVSWCKCI